MAYRPHGHAVTNPSSPSAYAICDRCGRLDNLVRLNWELQFRGPRLMKTGFLVCSHCLDVPQPQLKPRILPPDPVPVMNARPQNYLEADYDYQVTDADEILITQDDVPTVAQNVANNREDAE